MYAVTFDLWGTLIESRAHPTIPARSRLTERAQRLNRVLKPLGTTHTIQTIESALRQVNKRIALDQAQGFDWSFEVRLRELLDLIRPDFGGTMSKEALRSVQRAIDEPFTTLPPYHEIEAKGILQNLRRGGAKIGLISNTGFTSGPAYRQLLSLYGWDQLLDGVMLSNEVGLAKPNVAIFTRCLNALGVAASDALHVGDSLQHDVLGGQRAGLATVWLNIEGSATPSGICPDFVISELKVRQ